MFSILRIPSIPGRLPILKPMRKCLYCYNRLDENQVDYLPRCVREFFGTKQTSVLSPGKGHFSTTGSWMAKRLYFVPYRLDPPHLNPLH